MTDGIEGVVSGKEVLTGETTPDNLAARSVTALPVFQVAVVVDVIYDPQILTDEDRDKLKGKVEGDPGVVNPELVDRMTRKSIIARVISRGQDHSDNRPRIFLPGFPGYDHMPIKPGEQVFVFYADPDKQQRYGFWMWRVPEPLDVEDLNYTHGDRRKDENVLLTPAERAKGGEQDPPGFPNGNDEVDGYTLQEEKDYETIVEEAKASEAHVNEPVPRFSSRPGDRVIQGSNNARIVLGTDRKGPATDPPRPFSGTIDIVVGVGSDLPGDGDAPEGSASRVIENSRGNLETEKNPSKRNEKDHLTEGDPDFANDKSRIYISMNANADEDFEIEIPNAADKTPGEKPAIVLKTDQLRFVVREDFKIQVENGAAFVLKADGNIVVLPNAAGLIKLGGDDANKAILVQDAAVADGGTALGNPIITTMGGQVGVGAATGTYSTKVVCK